MAGNWKMFKTPAETQAFFEKFRPLVENSGHCEVVICPPFTNLATAVAAVKGSNIQIGSQNIAWAKEGAFTGEISGPMLNAVGVSHAIIGHSERRQYFGETDETVLKRTQAALEFGLTPIVCVGERLEERESGNTEAVLVGQFQKGIAGLTEQQFAKIVIAYEPVWAIGTGKTPTCADVAAMHAHIRSCLVERLGESAHQLRILYGGSVKADNAAELLNLAEVNGALVGGASLKAEEFQRIVRSVNGA
jgi:triosephosphate isomerase (TIM)